MVAMASLLHWLFPDTCQLCGAEGDTTLCPHCLAALERVPKPICLYCGGAVAGDNEDPYRCSACKGFPRSYDVARSALAMSDNALRLIHDLKYHGANHLARAMAPLLAEVWQETPTLTEHDDWVLVPVPITYKRLKTRRYNQAEELAYELSKITDSRVAQLLERRETGVLSQTRLTALARQGNARRAYHPRKEYAAGCKNGPAHVVLVDDVYTTGATARACAAALRKVAGVQKVAVLTLMRVDH